MAEGLPILIGGEWVRTEKILTVKNPYDGSIVGETYLAGDEELDRAAAASAEAFAVLKGMASFEKAEVLKEVSSTIRKRAEEIARTIALEAGKPIRDARAEAERAAVTFEVAAEEAKRPVGEVLALDITPASEGRTGLVRRFPAGPVLGITPFNFPLNLVAHKVAPAMAAGCPIIVKPASKTPISALLLGRIISEANWPAGGVSIIPSSGADAERLMRDERIKKLSFTGSAEVGWKLKSIAGMKKVTLELGGNAGTIICEDADLELAARRCTKGAFSYAGQICISVQRIYVARKVFDRFKSLFLEEAGKLKAGDPLDEATDLGPMIEEAAARRTEQWVREAVGAGAELLTGGKRRENFFEPTVITGTKPSMKVCSSEVFAPVVTLEAFDEYEDAVEMVNSGLYGLQAGVFTRDMDRVFYAYKNIEAGGVIVNDVPTFRVDNMPYGGVKRSGFGREGVRYAIEEMTELKILVLRT